jgi:hypothetical protein
MTNHKIKDFHRNRIAHICIVENFRNLARIMLTLNRLWPKQFYPKKVGEWLETYAENCRVMDKYDEAGVYDWKMNEWCEEYGINEAWCIGFVKRNSPTIKSPQNIIVLANNIKLALVQTCMEFGIGDKRLAEIRMALEDTQPAEPEKDLAKLGIEVEFTTLGQTDYRRLAPKKARPASYTDLQRGVRGLTALKAYQEEVTNADRQDT